jgi:hypothetical protein
LRRWSDFRPGFPFSPQVASYVTRHRLAAPTDAKENRLFEEYTTNSMREALRLLLYAHRLILEPENWTKEAWARARKGNPISVDHKNARSWCVAGAVLRAQSDLYGVPGPLAITNQETDEVIAVVAPKRVAVALELLGRFLVVANLGVLDVKLSLKKTGKKKAAEPQSTMLAAIVNEMPQIEHGNVLLGLAVAIDAVHEELYARSRKSAGKAGGAR